jgi:hypothetical protein
MQATIMRIPPFSEQNSPEKVCHAFSGCFNTSMKKDNRHRYGDPIQGIFPVG